MAHAHPDVAGRARYSLAEVVRKLGPIARALWAVAQDARNPESGECVLSDEELARRCSASRKAVDRAWARLRALGLAEDAAKASWKRTWVVGEDQHRRAGIRTWGRRRKVFGSTEMGSYGPISMAYVPRSAVRLLDAAPGRGGARPGAGRPRKSNRGDGNQTGVSSGNQTGVALKFLSIKGFSSKKKNGDEKVAALFQASQDVAKGPAAPATPPRLAVPPVLPQATPPETFPPAPSPTFGGSSGGGSASGPGGVGTRLGRPLGSPWPIPAAVLYQPGQGGIPPLPSPSAIGDVVILPEPPKLPDTDDPAVLLSWLERAYQGACGEAFGQRCWAKVSKSPKERAALLECAAAMQDRGIAPVAWALWSVGVWTDHLVDAAQKKPRRLPPLRWVFSAERVDKHHGWYGREGAGLKGEGRVLFGPVWRQLIDRSARMKADLLREYPTEPDAIAAVVQRHFPGNLWDELAGMARAEATEMRLGIRSRMQRGDWVW